MRNYGLQGLQEKLRFHIELAKWMEGEIASSEDFELMVPRSMNLVCFRFNPNLIASGKDEDLDEVNKLLIDRLNATGQIYLTHTKINDQFVIRMSIAQTNVEKRHIEKAWKLIQEMARHIS